MLQSLKLSEKYKVVWLLRTCINSLSLSLSLSSIIISITKSQVILQTLVELRTRIYLSNALPGSLSLKRELIFSPVSGGCRTRRAYKKYVLQP